MKFLRMRACPEPSQMSLKPDQPRDAPSRQCQQSRRALLLGSLVQATFQIKSAQAKQVARNQEADAATSPYIQGLLAKSIEKRDERAKAMLKDYMKRNYKDYFQYETGQGTKRGLSEESTRKIQQWLKDNG